MTSFAVLPQRKQNAAANMADDALLLTHWPEPLAQAILFRHYNWTGTCVTFGYSQPWNYAVANLPTGTHLDKMQLVRRATGGGIVDHRNDWTYSLLIPPSHPAYRGASDALYRLVHQAIAEALENGGQAAGLKPCQPNTCTTAPTASLRYNTQTQALKLEKQAAPSPSPYQPTICFNKAEIYDTLEPQSGRKQAGAALKRNQQGLLLQGSIDKLACPAITNWGKFQGAFIRRLAAALEAKTKHADWPTFPAETLCKEQQKFASKEWNEKR